jgi:hypothetical protein
LIADVEKREVLAKPAVRIYADDQFKSAEIAIV